MFTLLLNHKDRSSQKKKKKEKEKENYKDLETQDLRRTVHLGEMKPETLK